MVHLDYRDARPIYSQITEGFRAQIQAGVLQSGERLPSVRELAAALAINPNTIQRAYRELETQGWVVTVQGKGCFVNDRAQSPTPQQTLLDTFDRTVAELAELGVDRQALIARLREGGNHAETM